jgi:hypothetical protein
LQTINRNNYESFFLLYVDGELCAPEMKMVEDFAAANEDLGTELEMLKAAVLPMDEVLFEDKGELYKPIPIDSILHEKLLLKIDNELPEMEAGSLNELIATDENVGGEFSLLQRTKLDAAEKIVFADKHLLYRKERDNVVIGRFVRWAAAAVLLGFGFYFGANMLNKKNVDNGSDPIAKTGIPSVNKKESATNTATVIDPKNTAAVNADTDAIQNSSTATPANTTTVVAQNDHTADNRKNDNQIIPVVKDNIDPKNEVAQQNVLTPAQRDNIIPVQKIDNNPSPQIALVAPKEIKVQLPVDNTIVPLEDPYSKYVALNENDKSNNKILYMDEDDVKRSKVGGFFRKVKRFAERTAKVKTGNTLRIAGFAIASK